LSSFDAGCYIDIELVCGAGFEATEGFLRSSNTPEAEELLTRLEECKRAGVFDRFTPQQQLASYRRYYGISS
jgi:hypothetical protein